MAKKRDPNYWVWIIAYIEAKYMDKVNAELGKSRIYEEIEAHIPTIKVLKKLSKGDKKFVEVPLLFNYGFFKIPRKFAMSNTFLDELKENISCIYAWVRDPAKIVRTKPTINASGGLVYGGHLGQIPYGTATSEEVIHLIQQTSKYTTHDANDIDSVKPGDTIVLHGYPWDGMEAEIVSINHKKATVKCKLRIFDQLQEVSVDFQNVFFTIYQNGGYDDSVILANQFDIESSGNLKRKLKTDYEQDGN